MGKVYLVGAGPGEPELITLKGLELIKKAQVIIYDYLASKELLNFASPEAEIIYVGKKGGHHTMTQEEINDLLVEKGRKHIVVRLKGGDPFIFGRGGEEAQVLKREGIPFEIVPGVTAAIAVPAYAGIPLSHRDYTSSIAFITGHERGDSEASKINWKALADFNGTLVFLMGIKNLENIVNRLIDNGMAPSTPVAIIEWGTMPEQKTVVGNLGNIVEIARSNSISPPAIVVVGDVVKLRSQLNWYEKKPLFGRRVIVTRARSQASKLSERLRELGARCVEFPTIRIEPPPSWDRCDRAIERLPDYEWIIFTSVNGVSFFFKRLWEKGRDARYLCKCRVAAIGPATADELARRGIRVDFVPKSYVAEKLATGFSRDDISGKRILIPRALEAREILPETLEKMGAKVDIVPVYQTVLPEDSDEKDNVRTLLEEGKIDCVTFTSSSTVRNFFMLFKDCNIRELIRNVVIASIGPITSDTLRSFGVEVQITAKEYTIDGLCNAIVEHFSG